MKSGDKNTDDIRLGQAEAQVDQLPAGSSLFLEMP